MADWMNLNTAAEKLGVTVAMTKTLIHDGILPAEQVEGFGHVIKEEAIWKYLHDQTPPPRIRHPRGGARFHGGRR